MSTASIDETAERVDSARLDGRHLRRQRNIDAVRTTILDMLERRETPTLKIVAERSGVTIRSIYRYFDDLDDAVNAAREARIDEIIGEWRRASHVDLTDDFDQRVDLVVAQRMRLEMLGRPLRSAQLLSDHVDELDESAAKSFSPELDQLSGATRDRAATAVAFVLRPRSIRAMLETEPDPTLATETIRFTLRRILGDAACTDRSDVA
ncbi:MAG: hypothetical protein AAGG08_05895 [Actinomycetota bacterium]